jgi:endonuclease G
MLKDGGELSATAYLLTQETLLGDLEDFTFGEFGTYQVPVSRIEDLAGISFGALSEADPLSHLESALRPRRIRSPADLTV